MATLKRYALNHNHKELVIPIRTCVATWHVTLSLMPSEDQSKLNQ